MLGCRKSRENGRAGFILIVVIWFVGLLAILAVSFSQSVQTHLRLSSNAVENARAELLADAGVMLAVQGLVVSRRLKDSASRFPANGEPIVCSVRGEGRLAIAVGDEGGKIDINKVGLTLLETLIVGLGEPSVTASTVAAAILDYRDHDDSRRRNGAERADYLEAGLSQSPKNAPFELISEIRRVFGMTAQLAKKMMPHITVHSGQEGVDPRMASNELIAIIQRGMEVGGTSFAAFPQVAESSSLPAIFTSISQGRTFKIVVVGQPESGAVFVREAVVDVWPPRAAQFRFLSWTRGQLNELHTGRIAKSMQLPSC